MNTLSKFTNIYQIEQIETPELYKTIELLDVEKTITISDEWNSIIHTLLDLSLHKISKTDIIFLVGGIGSGKSTLLQYLLKKISQDNIAYNNLITLNLDVGELLMPDIEAVKHYITKRLLSKLSSLLEKREFNWKIITDIQTDFMFPPLKNYEDFRRRLFEKLSSMSDIESLTLILDSLEYSKNYKILLIIDNIDRLNVKYTYGIINFVHKLTSRYSILTFLVAIRSVLHDYSSDFIRSTFLKTSVIHLEGPRFSDVFHMKLTSLKRESTYNINLMREIIEFRIGDMPIIETISNNDIRKGVFLVNKILSSQLVYQKIIQNESLNRQDIIRSIMLGKFLYYDSNLNPIFNLFRVTKDIRPSYNCLLGFFLLKVINDSIQNRKSIIKILSGFGFSASSIIESIDKFEQYGLVYSDQDLDLLKPTKLLHFYELLLLEPPYAFLCSQDTYLENAHNLFTPEDMKWDFNKINYVLERFFKQLMKYEKELEKRWNINESVEKYKLFYSKFLLKDLLLGIKNKLGKYKHETPIELYLEISEKVNPVIIGKLLTSFGVLATPYSDTLSIEYAKAASFNATVSGSYSALTSIAKKIKYIWKVINKLLFIEENRNKIKAETDLIYAQVKKTNAEAKREEIEAFIDLYNAIGDFDKALLLIGSDRVIEKESGKPPQIVD